MRHRRFAVLLSVAVLATLVLAGCGETTQQSRTGPSAVPLPTATAPQQPTAPPKPTATPAPKPTATPAPKPTATPKPTVNPNASAPAYANTVVAYMSPLQAAMEDASTSCSAGDFGECRDDMQAVHDKTTSFQNALDRNPAPPCLQQVDRLLRAGLTDIHDGATLATRGIDDLDVSDIEAGGEKMSDAGEHFNDATTALHNASC